MRHRIFALGMAITLFVPVVWSQTSAATTKADVERILGRWKSNPQEVARKVMAKYGQPKEATATPLIWHRNGPSKRIGLVNEQIPHLFPKPHQDMLPAGHRLQSAPGQVRRACPI